MSYIEHCVQNSENIFEMKQIITPKKNFESYLLLYLVCCKCGVVNKADKAAIIPVQCKINDKCVFSILFSFFSDLELES